MKQLKTDLPHGFTLSTVKLDLSFTPDDYYESMIFDQHGDEVNCWRYISEEEARQGHKMLADSFFLGCARRAEVEFYGDDV